MFKRISAVFMSVILTLFSLCSCKKAAVKNFEPQKAFSCEISAEKNGFSFICTATCNSYDDVSMEFTSPSSLEGLGLTLTSDGITVNAYGLSDSFPADYIYETSPIYILLYGIRDGVFSVHEFNSAEDGTFTTEIQNGNSPIFISYSENGYIMSITVPAESFHAYFTY